MSSSARSVFTSGIYHILLGGSLVIDPNFLLRLFGFPVTSEIWIRILGLALLSIAFYDISAARANLVDFFRWSVLVRLPFVIFLGLFVAVGLVKTTAILFGIVELIGALWTAFALRSPEPV